MTLEDIFLAAVEKAPADRAAYLDAACGSDAELRDQVEALLRSHDEAGSLLEQPLFQATPTADQPPAADQPGGAIGPYKLLQQIGEGGMGTIWMAQQTEPVRRLVALKIIKPGLGSKQVLARFEAERQALALMDHPNIAKVLDAGETPTIHVGGSPRPYFVMELVKGVPITRYCDDHRLNPKDRLALFVQVCHAVQHAHQKGIIHRDLKPSNVLVAPYDGRPVVKVIDFGVAKAAGQPLTEKTLVTGFGTVVGTPEYMSPEQAELNNQDIDTRSDVYSLGVLLFELLTGSTPLTKERLKKAALLEVLRLVREEDPPKPSTRLSESKDSLPSISAQRQTEPAKLTKLVRGELDWIAMKALDKDRNRRYETANAFAVDVQRYLADEPVQAGPPGTGYRLRKFLARNRRTMAVVVLLGLMLLVAVGAVAGSLGWVARDRAARRATVEERARSVLREIDLLQEQEKWPEALAGAERLEGMLDDTVSEALRQHVRERAADLKMATRLEDIRLSYDINEVPPEVEIDYANAFREFGVDVDALAPEEAGARIRERSIRGELTIALDDWALVNRTAGTKGPKRWTSLLAVARAAEPEEEWRNRWRDALVQQKGRKALEELAASAPVEKLSRKTQALLGRTLSSVGAGQRAIALLRLAQQRHPDDFWVTYTLAYCLGYSGQQSSQWSEALSYYRAALALRPRVYSARNSVAWCLMELNKHDEAIEVLHEAIKVKSSYAAFYNTLGKALGGKGKRDEAIAAYRESIRLHGDRASAVHPNYNLGATLLALGRLDEARAAFREAIRIQPNYSIAHEDLGTLLARQGALEEAIASYRQAIRNKNNPNAHNILARLLTNAPDPKLRDPREAVGLARRAIQLTPAASTRPTLSACWNTLGMALYRTEDYPEALKALHQAIELNPAGTAIPNGLQTVKKAPSQGGNSYSFFFLAMTHWQMGEKELARVWHNQGTRWMEMNKSASSADAEELRRFRAEAAQLLGVEDPPEKKVK